MLTCKFPGIEICKAEAGLQFQFSLLRDLCSCVISKVGCVHLSSCTLYVCCSAVRSESELFLLSQRRIPSRCIHSPQTPHGSSSESRCFKKKVSI